MYFRGAHIDCRVLMEGRGHLAAVSAHLSHHVGIGDQIPVFRLGGNHLSLLNCLVGFQEMVLKK